MKKSIMARLVCLANGDIDLVQDAIFLSRCRGRRDKADLAEVVQHIVANRITALTQG